jgi:hypothetical protein
MASSIGELRNETARVINIRKRDLTEQLIELKGLLGKNASVIKNMRSRISHEQADFDQGGAKIHAVRSVHLKLLREVFGILSSKVLKAEMAQLTETLTQRGLKLGANKAYAQTFDRLRQNMEKVRKLSEEISSMLTAMFRQLNAEYGFSLQAPAEPNMDQYIGDLDVVQRSHVQYLSLSNTFKLAQPDFSSRLVRALATRLRALQEAALADIELWSKSAAAQLDAQMRERRRNFTRRIEAIDRIHEAAGGLDDRIQEFEEQEQALVQLEAKLLELTSYLIAAQDVTTPQVDLEIA